MAHTVIHEPETMPEMDIGIEKEDRDQIVDGLSRVLADTYTLYLKTHNYHWNITGPQFPMLHALFEEHYQEMWRAADTVAERIRALGARAPGTYKQLGQMTRIEEDDIGDEPDADTMVRNLVRGHEAVIRTARGVFPTVEEANDQTTMDILTERLRFHEKAAWMMRSILC